MFLMSNDVSCDEGIMMKSGNNWVTIDMSADQSVCSVSFYREQKTDIVYR